MAAKYAGLKDVRLTHPHPFHYSDLVLPLYFPAMIQLPTSHYSEDLFFEYTKMLHSLVGSDIHVAHSQYNEKPSSFYASNLYAAYEVTHWPGVDTQMLWTAWVIGVSRSFSTGTPVRSLPTKASSLFRRALRDEMKSGHHWFLERLPALRWQVARRSVWLRAARNPTGCFVVETEREGRIHLEHVDETSRKRVEYEPETTLARYNEFVIEKSCVEVPHGVVRTLLAFVRGPRKLPDALTMRGGAKVPFDDYGLYDPVEPRQAELQPRNCTRKPAKGGKTGLGQRLVASHQPQYQLNDNLRYIADFEQSSAALRATIHHSYRTPPPKKLTTSPPTAHTGDTIRDPNLPSSSPSPLDNIETNAMTAQEAIIMMRQQSHPVGPTHARASSLGGRRQQARGTGISRSPSRISSTQAPPRTFGDIEAGRGRNLAARGRGRGRGRGSVSRGSTRALQDKNPNAGLRTTGQVEAK